MKELPYQEEIYDFEDEQLELLFADLEHALSPEGKPTSVEELPKGIDSLEKFERKAQKLRELVEMELEERKKTDNMLNFFLQNAGIKVNNVDMLDDKQFYQPAAIQKVTVHDMKKQFNSKDQIDRQSQSNQSQQQEQRILYLSDQNLAKLPTLQQQVNPDQTLPTQSDLQEKSQFLQNSALPSQIDLSDVHSSISKNVINSRIGGLVKSKKDLQAFMREKLAKTKISSEATSSIQPIAQTQKMFGMGAVKAKDIETRTSASGVNSGVVRMGTASGGDKQQASFYKPQLKSTKESSNFVSGPTSTNIPKPKKAAASKDDSTKQNKKDQNSDKQQKKAASSKGVLEEEEGNSGGAQQEKPNFYKPPIKKPQSRQGSISKPPQVNTNKQPEQQPKSTPKEDSKAIARAQTLQKQQQLKQEQALAKQQEEERQNLHRGVGQWSQGNLLLDPPISELSHLINKDSPEKLQEQQREDATDESHHDNYKEEIESKYSNEEDEMKTNTQSENTLLQNDDDNLGGEDDDGDGNESEEEKVPAGSYNNNDDEEENDFYSELGATAPNSRLAMDISKENSGQPDDTSEVSSSDQSQSTNVTNKKQIRGKVQLIVDEVAVHSYLTTPKNLSQEANLETGLQNAPDIKPVIQIDTQAYDQKERQLYAQIQVLDQSDQSDEDVITPLASAKKEPQQPQLPQPSKTLELIKKITAQTTDEEAQQKRKEEQEERLRQIRNMMEQEKKLKDSQPVSIPDSDIQTTQEEKVKEKENATGTNQSDNKKAKEGSAAKKAAKPKTQGIPKTVADSQDTINGLVVKDYSGHYRSFYDIFVGQILEPKTFDLSFVVRDTRNTYASFVALMSDLLKSRKYQFDQAPLERSLADYYNSNQGALPSFLQPSDKSADGPSSAVQQALAQAELRERYQALKLRDISEILRDAQQKINAFTSGVTTSTAVAESSLASTSQSESSDSQLFYRVVKNRSEVYDIISRAFQKKKDWQELPHGLDLRNSWNLLWTWSKIKIDLSKLLVWQRCNHFSGAKNVSRKDFLKRNIEMAMRMSPKAAQVFNITPLTFILPKEYVQFLECFSDLEDKEGKLNYWIMKPAAKSRGRGISLINDLSQVTYGEPIVVQRYIKNPLLINGYKFDMRIYVVVTSVNPLEAFLYRDGFGRFSTIPFSLDPTDKNNKYIHLTNVSIQKYNNRSEYEQSEEGASDALYGGTKISIPTLRKRVQAETGVSWDDAIWPQVREVIVKTLVACQNDMQFNPCAFELFGYDILVDSDLRCWLIEVNSSPSLARDTLLDEVVKSKLIDDIIGLLDPMDFDRKRLFEVLERRINEGELKQTNQGNNAGGVGNIGSRKMMNRDLTYILNGRLPRKHGEMPKNMGNFERIAPSPQCEQYLKMVGGQKMFGSLMKIMPGEADITVKRKGGVKGGIKQQQTVQQQQVNNNDDCVDSQGE